MNERVTNSNSLIVFSALTYFFDLNCQITTDAGGRFTQYNSAHVVVAVVDTLFGHC